MDLENALRISAAGMPCAQPPRQLRNQRKKRGTGALRSIHAL